MNARRQIAAAKTSRRGAYLLLVGSIYVIIGGSLTFMPLPDSTHAAYATAATFLPIPMWGVVWMVTGLAGVVAAWWPPKRDIYGFCVLAAFSSAWAAMAMLSTILEGADRGWILALIWGQFAVALMIVSGMDRVRE